MKGSLPSVRGRVVAVSVSAKKGVRKLNVVRGTLLEERGLEGDAHGGAGYRQISLLAIESIDRVRRTGLEVGPGDFAENITTEGVCLWELPVGTRILIGKDATIEITRIGKECHKRCAVYRRVGECVMPREGVFARVVRGGIIMPGDALELIGDMNMQHGVDQAAPVAHTAAKRSVR